MFIPWILTTLFLSVEISHAHPMDMGTLELLIKDDSVEASLKMHFQVLPNFVSLEERLEKQFAGEKRFNDRFFADSDGYARKVAIFCESANMHLAATKYKVRY